MSDKSRRQILAAFAATILAPDAVKLEIADAFELGPAGDPRQKTKTLADLVKNALFGTSEEIYGIPGRIHPFFEGRTPPAERDALVTLLRPLQGREIIKLTQWSPEVRLGSLDTSLAAIGGPYANQIAKLFLGTGKGSPLYGDLPITFDLSEIEKVKATHNESYWKFIIDGNRSEFLEEGILISSVPNPYSPNKRLVNIAGLHAAGVRALSLLLEHEEFLQKIFDQNKSREGWQVLIPVQSRDRETPLKIFEPIIREINADFDGVSDFLSGTDIFNEPTVFEAQDNMVVAKIIEVYGKSQSYALLPRGSRIGWLHDSNSETALRVSERSRKVASEEAKMCDRKEKERERIFARVREEVPLKTDLLDHGAIGQLPRNKTDRLNSELVARLLGGKIVGKITKIILP